MVPETLESAPVCPAAPHSVERRKGRDGAAPQGSREAQERVPRCPASVGSQEKQKCRSVFAHPLAELTQTVLTFTSFLGSSLMFLFDLYAV